LALRAAAHILYYPEAWYTLHIDAPEGGTKMETEKVYAMPFAKIYPMLVERVLHSLENSFERLPLEKGVWRHMKLFLE
jgi:hypothetical protein